jgi:hypothetical protein
MTSLSKVHSTFHKWFRRLRFHLESDGEALRKLESFHGFRVIPGVSQTCFSHQLQLCIGPKAYRMKFPRILQIFSAILTSLPITWPKLAIKLGWAVPIKGKIL